jgi:hypothetical protein
MGIQGDTTKLDSPVMKFDSSVYEPPTMAKSNMLSMQRFIRNYMDQQKSSLWLPSELLNSAFKTENDSKQFSTASINKHIDKALQTKNSSCFRKSFTIYSTTIKYQYRS